MSDDDPVITRPGQMYGRRWDGTLEPAPDDAVPDAVICRRVADYPGQTVPRGATLGVCAKCGAPLAYNAAKFPEVLHICMQCARIRPLPIGH